MKIRIVFLLVSLCSSIGIVSAQETHQKFFGVETGMTLIGGDMSDMYYIRAEVTPYETGMANNNLSSSIYKSFIGVKAEIFSLSDKFGLTGGVRYSRINSSIGKTDYWISNPGYFYLLYRQDGINTEYLKVKEINQATDYIGIPIEMRFFPFRPRLFRIYFKLGAEFSCRLHSKTDIVFYNDAMESYQNEVAAMVGKPNSFSASVYGAAGVKLGRASKPSVSFEICLPTLFLTSESSSPVTPIAGCGFQVNIQIPIKSNVQ